MLTPYHNHKFTLYEGERLDDMVQSVKENGVLIPIIVQPTENGKYEILIGHNRWNASKLAGKPTVPAIVKEGLSEEIAEMYVIESNLLQRSFSDLKISEQAAVIALRHSQMFSQGKRNDIIRELKMLENPDLADSETLYPMDTKSDTNKEVGEEYGMSRATVARLIRIDKLIPNLKEHIDSGKLAIRAGVELSFLNDVTQAHIAELIGDYKIDVKKAGELRRIADENGDLSVSDIIKILVGDVLQKQDKPKSVKISHDTYSRYFDDTAKPDEVAQVIERALEMYFNSNAEE
jgi:ParB family chromosome partitioning protein